MPTDFIVSDEWDELRLYLQYEALTLETYSEMLKAIDQCYNVVARRIAPRLPFRIGDDARVVLESSLTWFPGLQIEDIRTGESILSRFNFDNRFLPSLSPSPDGWEVHLPRWSAAVVFTGILLAWGQDRIKTHYEIQNLRIENKIKRLHLQQLQDSLRNDDPRDRRFRSEIDRCVGRFWVQVEDSSLTSVSINDVELE